MQNQFNVVKRRGLKKASPMSNEEWNNLVEGIIAGKDSDVETLYSMFDSPMRYYILRQLGPEDLDDKVHDTFLIVLEAIQKGTVKNPERLIGFVRTVVKRHVLSIIPSKIQERKNHILDESDTLSSYQDWTSSPERQIIKQEKSHLIEQVFSMMVPRQREILERFYILEQKEPQICQEMHLTSNTFRLFKNRSKDNFGKIGRRLLLSNGMMRSDLLALAEVHEQYA